MTRSFIMRHIAKANGAVTLVDPRILGVASLAPHGPIAVIPPHAGKVPMRALSRRSLWRRAATLAVSVLVFLAVLPAVLPYDHILGPDAHAAPKAVHESHCHISPGTCSDASVTSGLGQLLLSEPLVLLPAMLAVLLVLPTLALRGISVKPDVRPPLPV